MTSAAETGEWSMLFQRQTLLTLFVLFMLWITHRALLSISHPRPHSPFRVGHGLHFCHSCSQARELICDSSRPALYLYDWYRVQFYELWQMDISVKVIPLLCWLRGRSTVRGRPCFSQLVWNSLSFHWNGRLLHQNGEDGHSAPEEGLKVKKNDSESAKCLIVSINE